MRVFASLWICMAVTKLGPTHKEEMLCSIISLQKLYQLPWKQNKTVFLNTTLVILYVYGTLCTCDSQFLGADGDLLFISREQNSLSICTPHLKPLTLNLHHFWACTSGREKRERERGAPGEDLEHRSIQGTYNLVDASMKSSYHEGTKAHNEWPLNDLNTEPPHLKVFWPQCNISTNIGTNAEVICSH